MRKASHIAVGAVLLLLSGLWVGAQTSPSTEPVLVPEGIAKAIQSIQEAKDIRAADAAYLAGAAVDGSSIPLNEAYMERMLQFGAPEKAGDQAKIVEKSQPLNGTALGIIAYCQAREGKLDTALVNIILAAQSSPEDPFIVRTAAQLAAWFDLKGDRQEIPDYVKESLADVRKDLSKQKVFKDAYDEAKAAYVEMEAAAAAREQAAQTQLSPGTVLAESPQVPVTLPRTPSGEPYIPIPREPVQQATQFEEPVTTVTTYDYPTTDEFASYPEPSYGYVQTYTDFGACAGFSSCYAPWGWPVSYWPGSWYPAVCYVPSIYIDIDIGFHRFHHPRLFGFADFHRHWDDIVFLGHIRRHGLLMGRSHGYDVVVDHARNVYIGNARTVNINRAGNVVINHADNVILTRPGDTVVGVGGMAMVGRSRFSAGATARPGEMMVLKSGAAIGRRTDSLVIARPDAVSLAKTRAALSGRPVVVAEAPAVRPVSVPARPVPANLVRPSTIASGLRPVAPANATMGLVTVPNKTLTGPGRLVPVPPTARNVTAGPRLTVPDRTPVAASPATPAAPVRLVSVPRAPTGGAAVPEPPKTFARPLVTDRRPVPPAPTMAVPPAPVMAKAPRPVLSPVPVAALPPARPIPAAAATVAPRAETPNPVLRPLPVRELPRTETPVRLTAPTPTPRVELPSPSPVLRPPTPTPIVPRTEMPVRFTPPTPTPARMAPTPTPRVEMPSPSPILRPSTPTPIVPRSETPVRLTAPTPTPVRITPTPVRMAPTPTFAPTPRVEALRSAPPRVERIPDAPRAAPTLRAVVPERSEAPRFTPPSAPVRVETPRFTPSPSPSVRVETPRFTPPSPPVRVEAPRFTPPSPPVRVETPRFTPSPSPSVRVETPRFTPPSSPPVRSEAPAPSFRPSPPTGSMSPTDDRRDRRFPR